MVQAKKILEIEKELIEIRKQNKYITDLWDTLTLEELQSIRKSNVFSRKLLRLYKTYYPFRSIKEHLPIIATVVVAAGIVGIIQKALKK